MCGRYSSVLSPQELEAAYGPLRVADDTLSANYNVAPTQQAPVITNRNPQHVVAFEWGLVPSWSKDGTNSGRVINARAEGVLSKPSFRKPIREQRCIVVGDSFYEWRRAGKQRLPFRIRPASGEPLLLAGLWDRWTDPKNPTRTKLTFSILTTAANAELSPVHDRMPILLHSPALRAAWLSELTDADITSLLRTPPDGSLSLYRVSSLVNQVRNNGPRLHEPEPTNTLW